MGTSKNSSKTYRVRRPRALSEFISKFTDDFYTKRGFPGGGMVQDWELVVGSRFAPLTQPIRIIRERSGVNGGAIVLHVANGSIASELKHEEVNICERINTYFGFNAVNRIRIVQRPLNKPEATNGKTNENFKNCNNNRSDIELKLSYVDDPDLKKALLSLGTSVSKRRIQKNKF